MNSNKKILLLIEDLSSGGAERQMTYLAVGLKKVGCQVRLLTFYDRPIFYRAQLDAASIPVEYLPEGRSPWRRVWVIRHIVKNYCPDLTVAYLNGTCMAACLAKLLRPFRLVVSERNTTQHLSLRERVKFILYSVADAVVPNSYSQARFINQHFPWLRNKVHVITNMVDTDHFSPIPDQTRGSETLHIITAARIMLQKNILRYLDAIALIKQKGKNVHFDWYGASLAGDSYAEQVQQKIRDLQLEDIITFHAPSMDIVDCYRQSDIFCLPSLYEGFPNVLCEAMACGLPVVCSDICDNPDIVEKGVNGYLFDPLNVQDMAEAILTMAQLPQSQRKALAKNNIDKIQSLCSEQRFVKEYMTFL